MPIAIKTVNLKYKNAQGQYVGVNTVGETTTAEQIAAIEAKGEEVIESIPSDYSELVEEVNGKYEKPASGIPASDLAAGAIPNEVIVSEEQPSEAGNKLWIQSENVVENTVPTVTEMQAADALKVSKPVTSPNGTNGQLLQTNGDGTTTWVTAGTPTDTQVGTAVEAWLDDHPEATTTVQDDAVTITKLDSGVKDIAFEAGDPTTMPVLVFESGGMYGATGIEFDIASRCRTKFIPVTPGETITFVSSLPNDNYHKATIFQFANNTKTSSGSNEIITALAEVVRANGNFTVGGNTNFIRIQISSALGEIQGKVALLHENYTHGTYTYTHTLTYDDIVQGHITSAGVIGSYDKSICTKNFYHGDAGITVHFVPGTTITDMCVIRKARADAGYASAWVTTESDYTLPSEYDIGLFFQTSDRDTVISPEDYDCTVTITGTVYKRNVKIYTSLDVAMLDKEIQEGQVVRTLGLHYPCDYGAGLYRVVRIPYAVTPNNCVLFSAANQDLYFSRIFDEPYVYLESLNIGNVAYSTINGALYNNHITDVRCRNITISEPISVWDYDFTFGFITYTGTDCALLIDNVSWRKFKGNSIYAPNADYGVKVTCSSYNTTQNIIEINKIVSSKYGLAIRPVNGHGIMHNHYRVNFISSSVAGMSVYIPCETGTYSWEGEELCTLNQVQVTNDNQDGVGVWMKIDPDPETGKTVDGTITGVTFTNLAVEGSDVGVKLECGWINTERVDACIKSIFINNLRGRESMATFYFLKGRGYIRDLYIKPTTPIQICQFDFSSSSGENPCFVDAPIMWGYHLYIFGWGLKFMLNQAYVARRMNRALEVTEDLDFSDFENFAPESHQIDQLFFADEFRISPDLRGQPVNIYLKYFWQESADGIRFYLPGAVDNQAVTVNVTYMMPKKTITITNPNAETHIYQIDVIEKGRSWNGDYSFIVRDLGAVANEIIVPYYYNEDNT